MSSAATATAATVESPEFVQPVGVVVVFVFVCVVVRVSVVIVGKGAATV